MTESDTKPPLLFLAHRLPYPPNKGDKIRSYHLLKHLSLHFRVYLGTFVDDSGDWQYCAAARSFCEELFVVERKPRLHKLLSTRGLIKGEAFSVAYYGSSSLQRWVTDTISRCCIDRVLLFCSPMAQFLPVNSTVSSRMKSLVIDYVDVDSEKWSQYSDSKKGLMRWVYRREAKLLANYEQKTANAATQSFLVSEPEAILFASRLSERRDAVSFFENGVDLEYFNPRGRYANPYPESSKVLVFTGAMDYWPNVDAVTWFAREIFPSLLESVPELEFWIVGSKPTNEVLGLGSAAGITVTGRVEDVRPFLVNAVAGVAPLRVARGVQNKVLECMAMERPVLVSSDALQGIKAESLGHVFVCTAAQDYVDAITSVLSQQVQASESVLRDYVRAYHGWSANLAPVLKGLGVGQTA